MDISSILSSSVASPSQQLASKPVDADSVKQQKSEPSVVSPKSNTQPETVEELTNQADQLNQQLDRLGQSIAFSVDENSQFSVVKVVDKTTDEIIRQFPSEGSLKIMKNIQSYLDTVQQNGLQSKEGLTGTLISEII
jgi:flagellar protein FlaG